MGARKPAGIYPSRDGDLSALGASRSLLQTDADTQGTVTKTWL